MRQVVEGMMPACNQNKLNILLEAPNEDLNVNVDTAKMGDKQLCFLFNGNNNHFYYSNYISN